MSTVSDLIADTLVASGIRRVYGIPGDSLNGFTDALRTRPELAWVHVRHEEAAAFAAAAEAELTGELAACAGSCGPGNLHLINGLYDAQRSRIPVLAIAAHIPSAEIGSGYFQETHPQELFRECSVYAEHVAHAEQMPRLLRIAMREALSKRGVTVLVIPGDIGLAGTPAKPERITAAHARVVPAAQELAAAAAAAERRVEGHDPGRRRLSRTRTTSWWSSPGYCTHRWCTRCGARSSSNTTTPTTWA